MLEIGKSEIWQIAEQYVLYKLDYGGGLFWLFDIEEGTCFDLNETSYFILSCFDGKTPTSKILQKVLSKYANENPEKVSNDFERLVNTLKKRGILSLVSP
jgi:methyltransferase-like protein